MLRVMLTVVLSLFAAPLVGQNLTLPMREGSTRFAVLGDSGTGGDKQLDVARQLTRYHEQFPFEFVIMLGDNLYGNESASDFQRKFERPYRPLLDAKVRFHAALGNHDDPNQRFYKLFNMNGERYYSFQHGITYFIAGSSAKLRRGNIRDSKLTAKGFDEGYTFMLVEISGDELFFQTITDTGRTVDSGVIRRTPPSSR